MVVSEGGPLLSAHGVVRRFGAFTALDHVDFSVEAGEVHALLGENGAGKSTLMNILSGLLRPTSGAIRMGGRDVRFASPADTAAQGIGMVHQHFLLVPTLSVAENLLLGASPKAGGPLSYPLRAVVDEAKRLADTLGWQIPWQARADSLSVGAQQRVEILKALRGETRVLIFDEPTAVLTPREIPELFATIRQLAQNGRGIVFISHKLGEVLELSQRVTVLRRGRVVYQSATKDTDQAILARAMVGEESAAARKIATEQGSTNTHHTVQRSAPPLLSVQNLSVRERKRTLVDNLSFLVAPGEIFGIAGVDGNGQTELAACLSGLRRPTSGVIRVAGRIPIADPVAFGQAGVAIIPADRQTHGLALPLTLTENFALTLFAGLEPTGEETHRGAVLLWPRLRRHAERLIADFDIRASGPRARASSLSGGNQQKVVIARALAQNPQVIVAVNPIRGLDVGAIAYVHDALREAQENGAAIVLISTELDEVLTLANRVAVLYEGAFAGIVSPETPRDRIGLLMGGEHRKAA